MRCHGELFAVLTPFVAFHRFNRVKNNELVKLNRGELFVTLDGPYKAREESVNLWRKLLTSGGVVYAREAVVFSDLYTMRQA